MFTHQALDREREMMERNIRVGMYLMFVVARLVEYNDGLGCIRVKLPVPLALDTCITTRPWHLHCNTSFPLTFFVRSFTLYRVERVSFLIFVSGVLFILSPSLLSRAFVTYVLWIHNTEFELGKIDNRWRRR